jgi:DNA-binding beta-propeller fold protein YncE
MAAALTSPALALSPQYVSQWGSFGADSLAFNGPTGIALGGVGVLYVVDSENDRVKRYDLDGNYLGQWGSTGPLPGMFDTPSGVWVCGSPDTVYITDSRNHRIQILDENGIPLGEFGPLQPQYPELLWPMGITRDSAGHFYVTDFFQHRLQKYAPDGTHIEQWGQWGSLPGEFIQPAEIVEHEGLLYIADWGNDRIQVLSSEGAFVSVWGASGTAPGELMRPWGLKLDVGNGFLYVVDGNNHRVQKFMPDGTFLCGWGTEGTGPGQFSLPRGIATGADGRDVYVIDGSNERVQMFSYDPVSGVESVPTPVRLDSYPNPFSRRTVIEYEGVGAIAEVVVYDVRGRHVRTLVEGRAVVGAGSVAWDGTGARGEKAPAGVYFVRMVSGAHEVTRRIVLLR